VPIVRLCSVGGCTHAPVQGGRCRLHAQQAQQRKAAKWRNSKAGSAAWRRVREQVLARDRYRCRRCGTRENLSVHIAPWLKADHSRARLEDSVTLCLRCHGTIDGGRAAR
jgi:5-methylcytosine-specific restriction endonuclease McrA